MSQIRPGTKHVRLDPFIYEKLKTLSHDTGFSAAEIASLCVEDCMTAFETRKAIIPRILRIRKVIEEGPEFEGDELPAGNPPKGPKKH